MRLDKYLKISRLVKRRTIAKEICDQGRIKVNGRTAKAGADVQSGDILQIGFGKTLLEVEILKTPEHIRANLSDTTYRIIRQESTQNAEDA